MATYLSLDLDFFDRIDSIGNTMLLRQLLARVSKLPSVVVMSHEELVPHIMGLKRIKFNRLINLDEHSDLCGWRRTAGVFQPGELDCGNWVDHVPFAKGNEYIWYIPPCSAGCDCAEESYLSIDEVRWRWRKRRTRQWGNGYTTRAKLPWRDIKAAGIAMSPDYTDKVEYLKLKKVVMEYYTLPSDCIEIEQRYGIGTKT